MKKRLSKKDRPAFLIAEGIISLIVCLEAVWILTSSLSLLKQTKANQCLNFHNYLALIESKKYQFKIKRLVDTQEVVLYSKVENKLYRLERYQRMIRITGNTQGHIRCLPNIRTVRWALQKGNLQTNVTFCNGETYQALSKLE